MSNINEDIYNEYFGKIATQEEPLEKKSPRISPRNLAKEFSERKYPEQVVSSKEYDVQTFRQMADGNIDDIEQLALILKKLCNAAWGANW